MKIDLLSLDVSIRNQLPLSLQLETAPVELNALPVNIQKLINDNVKSIIYADVYRPINIIDLTFKKSNYNDIEFITSKRKAIIEYIQNFLLTPKGSYPFDPEFGTEIKNFLHVKNSLLQQSLLDSELKNISNVLSDSFNEEINILSSTMIPYNLLDRIEYVLDIRFSIDEEEIIFRIK